MLGRREGIRHRTAHGDAAPSISSAPSTSRDLGARRGAADQRRGAPGSARCRRTPRRRRASSSSCTSPARTRGSGGKRWTARGALRPPARREHRAEADWWSRVPDSANSAALGFAEQSGIRFELGLIRNHYVGRTFIEPSQAGRDFKAPLKYNPVREILAGKRVVVVDDSLVRGTTARGLVKLIREAGANEVHFRIASPPVRYPCFYGIDMPTQGGADRRRACRSSRSATSSAWTRWATSRSRGCGAPSPSTAPSATPASRGTTGAAGGRRARPRHVVALLTAGTGSE